MVSRQSKQQKKTRQLAKESADYIVMTQTYKAYLKTKNNLFSKKDSRNCHQYRSLIEEIKNIRERRARFVKNFKLNKIYNISRGEYKNANELCKKLNWNYHHYLVALKKLKEENVDFTLDVLKYYYDKTEKYKK